jgi:hypothetical protein
MWYGEQHCVKCGVVWEREGKGLLLMGSKTPVINGEEKACCVMGKKNPVLM